MRRATIGGALVEGGDTVFLFLWMFCVDDSFSYD